MRDEKEERKKQARSMYAQYIIYTENVIYIVTVHLLYTSSVQSLYLSQFMLKKYNYDVIL